MQTIKQSIEIIQSASLEIEKNPQDEKGYVIRAEAYYDNKEYSRALEDANSALLINSKSFFALLIRASCKLIMNDLPGAIQDSSEVIQLDPNLSNMALMVRAQSQMKLGLYSEAIIDCESIPDNEPELFIRLTIIGYCYAKSGQYDEAQKFIQKALSENPEYNWAKIIKQKLDKGTYPIEILLSCFERESDFKTKLDYFNKAVEINAFEAYHGRARINSQQARFKQAIDDFTKAIELDSENPSSYYLRGFMRSKVGDQKGAIADCDKALTINSSAAYAYYYRAYANFQLGDYSESLEDLHATEKLNPKMHETRCLMGRIYKQTGDHEKARHCFERSIEIKKNQKAYTYLAGLHAFNPDPQFRDLEKALNYAESGVRIEKNVPSLETLAAIYAEMGNFMKAIEIQSESLKYYRVPDEAKKGKSILALYEQKKKFYS